MAHDVFMLSIDLNTLLFDAVFFVSLIFIRIYKVYVPRENMSDAQVLNQAFGFTPQANFEQAK